MSLLPGTQLGPYEILSPLGSGAMGEVYRARDPRLGREVAVKVLRGASAPDPDRARRFEQEARAAGSLAHPNVLTVFDVGIKEGVPYLVSELLEGTTLRSALAMTDEEQERRMAGMRRQVLEHNIFRWAGKLLQEAARLVAPHASSGHAREAASESAFGPPVLAGADG